MIGLWQLDPAREHGRRAVMSDLAAGVRANLVNQAGAGVTTSAST